MEKKGQAFGFEQHVISLILVILVIAIVIGGGYFLYTNYLTPLAKPDFQDLDQNAKSAIQGAADKFINNLENCKNTAKNSCVCKNAFIEFPNEVGIRIKNEVSAGNRVNIEFLYNDKVFRNNTIDKAFMIYSFYDKTIKEEAISEYSIKFDNGKAEINGKKIISNYLYKSPQSYPTASRISFIVYESQLFETGEEKIQKEFFENLTDCSDISAKPAMQVDDGARKFIESMANAKFEQEIRAQSQGTGITEEKIQEAVNNPTKRVEIMLSYGINPNLLMGGLPYQEKKCEILLAKWSKTAVRLNEPVNITIRGQNCENLKVAVQYYRANTILGIKVSTDLSESTLIIFNKEDVKKFEEGKEITDPFIANKKGKYYALIYIYSGSSVSLDPNKQEIKSNYLVVS